ncbi:acyclic terpene utilization AtuA family protein [Leucobacter komagatae]|uniref:acyclic terpene utilization AtuA family protein n=1 Tax=Leucobacter komagatae TaxID=55969 RepID=UPI000B10C225|nr:acyclic terpene utilization AtuA family protein [Leucobacter komagatae]
MTFEEESAGTGADTPAPDGGAGRAVRIGNASGFYGDRLSGFDEMVAAGVDVITGDYLAELTMLILARQKQQDPTLGYAKTFLTQLGRSLDRVVAAGTRVVANAGGMNPAGLAAALRDLAAERDVDLDIAYVDGDDLTDSAQALGLGSPLAANAYLGGWGITEALRRGAQIVVTGRVTDAAVITGAAAWFHAWGRTDYDRLAGAMAAGHVIECGMQATGGNFAFFEEITDLLRPGFPIAEISADGDSVITKPAGTGGAVTAETVLSQLLYEIAGARYPGPDATLRLDSLSLAADGPDRVRISGAIGEAPPPDLKVSVTEIGGFRQQLTFPLVGLRIAEKAELIARQYAHGLEQSGLPSPERMEWFLARTDHPDAATEETAAARLTLVARDPNPKVVGRAFANLAVEFALGSIPGFFTDGPPADATVYGRFRPGFVPQRVPAHTAHLADGSELRIPPPDEALALAPTELDTRSAGAAAPETAVRPSPAAPDGVTLALGELFGARSGDKGATANVGVWARSAAGWEWLRTELTIDRLRELLPEAAALPITRVELANLRAVNFVIEDILGEGVAYGARFDPQAKGLGEWLRSRHVSVPRRLAAQRGLHPEPLPHEPPTRTAERLGNAQ